MIEVSGLSKVFGTLRAVDRITFNVRKEEILGLLGPNGAGKTTTIRMLTATVSGTVLITTFKIGCIDTVEFYIDGALKSTDTSAPFECLWDTTTHLEGLHTVYAKGYYAGTFIDDDTVTATLQSPLFHVTITDPSEGQTVSGTVTCIAISNCDSVKWYIDGTLRLEDVSPPFEYSWDTTAYDDGSYTIEAEGYCSDVCEDSDVTAVTVDNIIKYVLIANPQKEATVSHNVIITTETCYIDTVKFYIDGILKHTDETPPFEYKWKTKKVTNGIHTIKVEGYYKDVYQDSDEITVTVENKASIVLFSLLALFLFAGIAYRRH